jgi:hypothetical protein
VGLGTCTIILNGDLQIPKLACKKAKTPKTDCKIIIFANLQLTTQMGVCRSSWH